ncbi:MAG TPA: hypothetical protein VNI54_10745 [Thermoanaerobaculia bacterium]|nr:hypothetical protein [Thermoanaerobaculia bacterium]
MKRLWLAIVLLLAAGTAGAAQVETALAEDNLMWSIDSAWAGRSLILTLSIDDDVQYVMVPTTSDEAIDAQPRIAWDATSRTLFVLWRREGANGDEIRLARRYASGRWAPPIVVADGANAKRAGMQFVVTHAKEEPTTLVHVAWWTLGEKPVAEYALAAFNGAELLSTSVDRLEDLAAVLASAADDEDTGKAAHPPLAMVRSGEGVDVAFGAPRTTAITRVQVDPRKIGPNARIWRPSGKSGRRTPGAQLVSATSTPVQSFIVGGNVVLYTPESRFRYVILEDARWTPVRMLATDAKVTSDDLVRELRRSVAEQGAAPSTPDSK